MRQKRLAWHATFRSRYFVRLYFGKYAPVVFLLIFYCRYATCREKDVSHAAHKCSKYIQHSSSKDIQIFPWYLGYISTLPYGIMYSRVVKYLLNSSQFNDWFELMHFGMMDWRLGTIERRMFNWRLIPTNSIKSHSVEDWYEKGIEGYPINNRTLRI